MQLVAGDDVRLLAAAAFAAGLVAWAFLLRWAVRGELHVGLAVLAMALTVVICVAFPPATSKDVNSYAMYGHMVATYDASPYEHVPRDFPADPWFSRVSYFWNDAPSVYGPVFSGLSAIVMSVAGPSFTVARLGFQIAAALSLLAAVALARRRLPLVQAVVLIGLNPLLLTFGVNDAHADVLMGLAVLAGVLALGHRRVWLAGTVLALAALVKISALPALAGAAVWVWFRWGVPAAGRLVLAAGATIGAGLFLSGGLSSLEPLGSATGRHTRFSVWNPGHDALTTVLGNGPPANAPADAPIALMANLTVAVVGLVLIYRHRKDTVPVIAVVAGLVAYQVLGAYTLSWYAAWSLPALALAWRGRMAAIAMAHGSWLAIAYLSGFAAIAVVVALVLWILWRRRSREPAFPWLDARPQRILAEP